MVTVSYSYKTFKKVLTSLTVHFRTSYQFGEFEEKMSRGIFKLSLSRVKTVKFDFVNNTFF